MTKKQKSLIDRARRCKTVTYLKIGDTWRLGDYYGDAPGEHHMGFRWVVGTPSTRATPGSKITSGMMCYKPKRPNPKSKELFIVTTQGGPVLNSSRIVAANKNMAAIEINMTSNGCEVLADTASVKGPGLWIIGEHATKIEKGTEKQITSIKFHAYKGWKIFSADVFRYTLRVCLLRKR